MELKLDEEVIGDESGRDSGRLKLASGLRRRILHFTRESRVHAIRLDHGGAR